MFCHLMTLKEEPLRMALWNVPKRVAIAPAMASFCMVGLL